MAEERSSGLRALERFQRKRRLGMNKSLPSSSKQVLEDDDAESSLSTINVNDLGRTNDNIQPTPKKPVKSQKQKAEKRWKWEDDMVDALLDNLYEYKNDMTFRGFDFQADLVQCYNELQKMMAQMYPPCDFGPVSIPLETTEEMNKEELISYKKEISKLEKQKKEGYQRIKVKVKELRAGYKTAIDKGTRSGSGKLVREFFDKLQEIWGGSPAVTELDSGLCSLADCTEEILSDDALSESDKENEEPRAAKILDNKRDKMKKKLSAHQRDMIQVDLTREELKLKKEAIEIMRKNCQSTNEAIQAMTNSITNIGQGIKDGLAMLATAMLNQGQNQMMPQNVFSPPPQSNYFMTTPPSFSGQKQ